MRKNRNSIPSPPMYSLEDEINTSDYPYYRDIPIKHISDKQHQLLDRYKSVKVQQVRTLPSSRNVQQVIKHQSYDMTDPIPEQNIDYNASINSVNPIPVFNLIHNPGENFYWINTMMSSQQPQQPQQQDDIIAANNAAIAKQAQLIHTQNNTIQQNNEYIQQQAYAYNNNIGIIQQQLYTYQTNATYITEQEQTIESLKGQVHNYELQLEQMKQEIESNRQQLAYHCTMLSAFNTMLQNPAYFAQLVTMSGYMPPDDSI